MNGAAPAVLCAGRLYCDMLFGGLSRLPAPGEEAFAASFCMRPGGGAFITAAYLAALGLPASLLGFLPAEPFAAALADGLAASGVDLSRCRTGGLPQVTAVANLGGDRAFITHRPGPALPDLVEADLAGARHLHIGELATLVAHPGLLALARGAGLTTSLDCSWDPEAMGRPDAAALIAGVDVFLPNEAEAARLGEGMLADLAHAPGGPLVVVKAGSHGARLLGPCALSVPAVPATVVDTTGAGDAFNAGFLAAWLGGASLERCIATGVRCGAHAIGQAGGTVGPELAEAVRAD